MAFITSVFITAHTWASHGLAGFKSPVVGALLGSSKAHSAGEKSKAQRQLMRDDREDKLKSLCPAWVVDLTLRGWERPALRQCTSNRGSQSLGRWHPC